MLRRIFIRIVWVSGLWRLFRLANRQALTILLYHGVAPQKRQGMYNYAGKFIPPEAFAKQLALLKKLYRVLPLDEAVAGLKSNTLPPYAAVITFDDGYRNFYDYAFPLLQAVGLTATVFLPTNFVFKQEPLWVDRLEYLALPNDAEIRRRLKSLTDSERLAELEMLEQKSAKRFSDFAGDRAVYAPLSREMIVEMQKAGITFGAHTQTHPILTQVPQDQLAEEIRGSKNILVTELGQVSNIFCYPNGQPSDFSPETEAEIKLAGFGGALTTVEGLNTKTADPYRLKRITPRLFLPLSRASSDTPANKLP